MEMDKKQAVKSVLTAVKAYADAIRGLKEVPSGELYAQTMSVGVTLETHNKIIELLKRSGLISIDNSYLIKWIAV